jgi:hypothetical protein
MDLSAVIRRAALDASDRWGRDLHGPEVEDLQQDLWVWYYQTPSVSTKLEAADTEDYSDEQTAEYARQLFVGYALQLLAKQSLESDTFEGKALYSSEAIKTELKGASTNKYLRRILPIALADLEKFNAGQREALRKRYVDGVIPQNGDPASPLLARAHESLTRHVNALVIAETDADDRNQSGESRSASGGHSDPTANMALALMARGDEVINILNQEGSIVGTTTLREEAFADGFQMVQGGHRSGADRDTLFDGMFSDIERAAMYKAQVFPELFPDERPFLLQNWPAEDLEAYCGGEFTPGQKAKLSVVR